METIQEDLIRDVNYLWPQNADLERFYEKPFIVMKGKGAVIWDITGKEYIDATAGVFNVNIGHSDPRMMKAIQKQMEEISFTGPYVANAPAIRLAKKLVGLAPWKARRVFFTSGGSESTETAIKMARQYHLLKGNRGKYRVIGRWISFHGASLGALSATGFIPWRKGFEPLLLNFPHVSPAYPYRMGGEKECTRYCAEELEKTIKAEGPETISAFIAEPVVGGAGGAIVPPDDYFPIVREICDKYEILLIYDEIITGFGRIGKMFGCEHWKAWPDLVTFGKGATSGYTPMGGVLVSGKVADEFTRPRTEPFIHAFTYGGNPLCCAAALACIDIIEKDGLVERSARTGSYLLKRLGELSSFRSVGDVRGKGLLAAVEFVKNKDTREIFPDGEEFGQKVAQVASEDGVKIFGRKGTGNGFISDFANMSPPLVVTQDQVDRIVDAIRAGIVEAERIFLKS